MAAVDSAEASVADSEEAMAASAEALEEATEVMVGRKPSCDNTKIFSTNVTKWSMTGQYRPIILAQGFGCW